MPNKNIIRQLISAEYFDIDEIFLIESPFKEVTRNGHFVQVTQVALTSNKVIIATEKMNTANSFVQASVINMQLSSLCPLDAIVLSIFKNTKRQVLKATFSSTNKRYFELENIPKRMLIWKTWCMYIYELSKGSKTWPYRPSHVVNSVSTQADNMGLLKKSGISRKRWTDKHLFFGDKREIEDSVRPLPVPGLGAADDIGIVCLKPQYFGCWDQSEHWVQCSSTTRDNELYTYTGEPTSNVTYTSLITMVTIAIFKL